MKLASFEPALRILSHFWLEEVQPGDQETIAALPQFAAVLDPTNPTSLAELAVEYQRLFGFNCPPYESIFIDPSVMLQAPATERVQRAYQQGGWLPPSDARTGAPDHIGLELLALAGWAANQPKQATNFLVRHPALWFPLLATTLHRLRPHPFYAALVDLTLDLLLSALPPDSESIDETTLLPPVPASQTEPFGGAVSAAQAGDEAETELRLRHIIKRLLTPRETGLYLTREDLAAISTKLDLPGVMGDRFHMLESLFRLAGQYELVPQLLAVLSTQVQQAGRAYQQLAGEYPAWRPHAAAWSQRILTIQTMLDSLQDQTRQMKP